MRSPRRSRSLSMVHIGIAMMVCAVSACGPRPAPESTGPSSFSALLAPHIDGLWGGQATLIEVSTGAGSARNVSDATCITNRFRTAVGETLDHTLAITQTETDLQTTLAYPRTGLSCGYAGRLGTSSATLTTDTCRTPTINVLCDGAQYDLQLVGSTLTLQLDAPVRVTSMTGTVTYAYNVFLLTEDGTNRTGTLVSSHRLTGVTRR